ncbi:hypothetical protein, partial [Thomasclavelia spiroformis]
KNKIKCLRKQVIFHDYVCLGAAGGKECKVYMLIRIKKLQFICGIFLLLQVFCSMWWIPFHLLASLLSIIIIGWQKKFCVLQVQYHYYVLVLYCFRIWLLGIDSFIFLETIYMCLCLYFSFMIILFSFRAIL